MVAVVQPDADDLADCRERRPEAPDVGDDRQRRDVEPAQPVAQERAGHIGRDRPQIVPGSVGVADNREFLSGLTMPRQAHYLTPPWRWALARRAPPPRRGPRRRRGAKPRVHPSASEWWGRGFAQAG